MSNDKHDATYHGHDEPEVTEEKVERNEHGGIIHQAAGVVGVGSGSGIVDPPVQHMDES